MIWPDLKSDISHHTNEYTRRVCKAQILPKIIIIQWEMLIYICVCLILKHGPGCMVEHHRGCFFSYVIQRKPQTLELLKLFFHHSNIQKSNSWTNLQLKYNPEPANILFVVEISMTDMRDPLCMTLKPRNIVG